MQHTDIPQDKGQMLNRIKSNSPGLSSLGYNIQEIYELFLYLQVQQQQQQHPSLSLFYRVKKEAKLNTFRDLYSGVSYAMENY